MSGNDSRGEGGGRTGVGGAKMSWAQRLGNSLPSTMNKNILEVILEKDKKGAFVVKDEECARMMQKIGLDPRPGVQVEGVQICPSGKGVILITLRDEVRIEDYCRYDVLVVTDSGIRSTMMKPACKKEVVINMKGIHPNTRDTLVIDYLSKFGKVVTTKVVHGVFLEGPLKGIKNGDRAYKVELKPGQNVGSYHYIDGQKVSLRYQGQQQTCGRCHETSQKCKGKGIAKRCESEGGIRIEFADHILALWERIGYAPPSGEVTIEVGEDQVEEVVDSFSPAKVNRDEDRYAGVTIRQLPIGVDPGEVIEFLCENGLPDKSKENVTIGANGVVTIQNLDNLTSRTLIEAVHGKVHFGKKLFCNGLIPLTPQKPVLTNSINSQEQCAPPSSPGTSACVPPCGSPRAPPGAPASAQHDVRPKDFITALPETSVKPTALPPAPVRSPSFVAAVQTFESYDKRTLVTQPCDEVFVRRHSLSLSNRTPPRASIAGEILGSGPDSLLRAKTALKELKGITDQLSEFGSCLSNSSSSSSDETSVGESEIGGFKTMNERKRNKKKKRKLQVTPDKDSFLKKPNTVQK